MQSNKETKQRAYMKQDPLIPGQKLALVSMVKPRNHDVVKNFHAFLASKFLASFVPDYFRAIEQESEEKNLDKDQLAHIAEVKDHSFENIQKLFYEFCHFNQDELTGEFQQNSNPKGDLLVTAMKVRGTYADKEQMQTAIEELHAYEPFADIYCCNVGQWVPWCPGDSNKLNVKYAEDKLDKLMSRFYNQHKLKTQIFEQTHSK